MPASQICCADSLTDCASWLSNSPAPIASKPLGSEAGSRDEFSLTL